MSFQKWMLCVCAASLVAVAVAQAPAQTPAPKTAPPAASPPAAAAQGEPEDAFAETPLPAGAVDLGTIVVGGRQPGPGL